MAKNDSSQSRQISFFNDKPNASQSNGAYANNEPYDSVTNSDLNNSTEYADIDPDQMTDAEIAPEHTVRPQKVTVTNVRVAKKTKKKKSGSFFEFNYKNSFILNLLALIGNAIGKAFRNSFTASVFTAFSQTKELFSESFTFKMFSAPKAENASTEIKKKFRKEATIATIPSAISGFFSSLIRIRTRIYGYLLFFFGITALLGHFFITNRFDTFNIDKYAPITSITVLLSAIFLILCNKSLAEAIKDSRLLSMLFFNFLGIKRPAFNDDEDIEFSASAACFIGLVLGTLTFFFPAHLILAVIFTAIYTYLVVKYPETGIISLILIIPFLYNTALVYITLVITLSYLFKIFSGKRTASFEFPDLFILFFLVLTLISELITFGSGSNSMMYTAFILVYFICISALCDGVWFERAVNSLVFSTAVFSAYALFASLLGRNIGLEIEFVVNTDMGDPTKSVISSTAVLSLFVMCGIIFLLTAFFTAKSKSNKFAFMLLIAVALIYIFIEASISVISALIISLLVYLVLISNKTVIFVVAGAIILPLLPLFYSGVYSPISNVLENEMFRLEIWSAVINMLSTYGFTGIGMAPNAFSELYASYYVGNTATVTHAHSFWFQLAISLGIPGLILFIIIAFFILQGAFSYGRNTADKWSKNRLFCYAGMCSMLALLICGITEQIAYNPRIFLLFWLMCGLTVCARRSAKDVSSKTGLMIDFDVI